MQEIVIKHNEIVNNAPADCEIFGDHEMVKEIERGGKDELDDYFGYHMDDDALYEDEDDGEFPV